MVPSTAGARFLDGWRAARGRRRSCARPVPRPFLRCRTGSPVPGHRRAPGCSAGPTASPHDGLGLRWRRTGGRRRLPLVVNVVRGHGRLGARVCGRVVPQDREVAADVCGVLVVGGVDRRTAPVGGHLGGKPRQALVRSPSRTPRNARWSGPRRQITTGSPLRRAACSSRPVRCRGRAAAARSAPGPRSARCPRGRPPGRADGCRSGVRR